MSESVITLPVSVEQIALAIKQMGQTEQQRLLELVPELRRMAVQPPPRTIEQAQITVANLQTEIWTALRHQPLSPDEPFLRNLTLKQYEALSETEKVRLWDELAEVHLLELEEQEINPDALPAG